ncbi:Rossmann-fold NAD(P)-binding domain-containing protein [Streptomyces misionensis]|uniref:hypothetical protein n=1 Tax=Streptomyces misionensis TaxID=67331 RepID=UPI0036BD3E33
MPCCPALHPARPCVGRATHIGAPHRTAHDVTLAQPGPVSSGALDDILTYRLPDDPYAALFAGDGIPAEMMISPEQVAAAVADLVEAPEVPLRVPVGPVAEHILSSRDSAPYDKPFLPF